MPTLNWISIDDYEYERLKLVMTEIFGAENHVATFIWKRRTTPDSRNLHGVSGDHEYVVCYQRAADFRVRGQAKSLNKYTNPDDAPRGPWMSDNLTGLANAIERPNLHYEIVHPETEERFKPHPSRGWIYGRERMAELIKDNRILWPQPLDFPLCSTRLAAWGLRRNSVNYLGPRLSPSQNLRVSSRRSSTKRRALTSQSSIPLRVRARQHMRCCP